MKFNTSGAHNTFLVCGTGLVRGSAIMRSVGLNNMLNPLLLISCQAYRYSSWVCLIFWWYAVFSASLIMD